MAAINQIDKELNDRLLQYARTIANGDRTLEQTLRSHAKSLGSVQQDVVSEYEEHLNTSRTWHGKEAQAAKERLIRMKKLEQQADKAHAEQINADLDFQKKLKELRQDELLARRSNDTKQVGLVRRQMIQMQQNHTEDTKRRKAEQELGRWAAAERRSFERSELSNQAKWGNAFRKVTSDAAMSAIKNALGGATLSGAIANVTKDAYTGIKKGMMTGGYGVGMLPESAGGSAFNINTMSKFGYNMEQSIQLQAENRRAILSSTNGMKDFVSGMDDAYRKFDFIANPLDRSKIAIDSYNIAVKSGIRMSKEQATMFVNDIKKFTKYTGENATEFTTHISSIMESQEVQSALMGASNDMQRKAILDGVTAQYTANRAMGMTADQAKNAATALAKIGNEKSKKTIVDAVKLRAYMSTIGMGREGAELQRLMMKRQNLTPEERNRKQELLSAVKNESDRRSWGNVNQRTLQNDALIAALGVDQLSDSLNTNIAKAVSPQEDAFKTIPEIPKAIQDGTAKLEEIKNILQNHPLAQIGVGATGSALNMFDIAGGSMGGTLGANMLSRFIPGFTGVGGTAATGVGGTAATGVGGTAATGVGTMASSLALAAAPLLAMYGVTNWAEDQSHDEERVSGLTAISDALKSILPEWAGDPSKAAREKREAQLGELNGGPESEYAAIAAKSSDVAAQVADNQAKQMDQNNTTLDRILAASQQQLEISEKQLAAMAVMEQSRPPNEKYSTSRGDSRFGSKYGYV